MQFDEFKKLAKGMKSIWTKKDFLPDKYALEIWYGLLKDLPYEQASLAVTRYAATSNWPPTPADIRRQVVMINDESTDWGEAWGTVLRAIGRFGMYREAEAMDSLDELTRDTIRRLGWKQICTSDQDELTAIRANFRMIYEQSQDKAKETAQLPDSVKKAIARIGKGGESEKPMLDV